MCLSLAQDVTSVISSLIVTHPGIYLQDASSALRQQYASLNSVMNGNFTSQPLGTSYAITTAGGVAFTLFAKNKEWDRYLYEQLVAPVLNSDLIVESWTNGADSNIDPSFCKNRTIHYSVYNAMHINFGEGAWARSKDHSKVWRFCLFLRLTKKNSGRSGFTTRGCALAASTASSRRTCAAAAPAARRSCRRCTTLCIRPLWT